MFDKIKKLDPTGQFEVLKKSADQVEDALNNHFDLRLGDGGGVSSAGRLGSSSLGEADNGTDTGKNSETAGIKNIVICGLGGSAIAGDILALWGKEELKVPLYINRNYGVPNFVSSDSLVVLSSYSGTTEETLSAYHAAGERGAKRICLTTGGTLKELAGRDGVTVVPLMPGFQPRYALYTSFFNILNLFSKLELLKRDDELLRRIVANLRSLGEKYSQPGNRAYQIAQEINGKLPIIYSAVGVTDSIGTRFKGQFNENGKTHAFHNVFPEMNHNEIIGWETYGSMNENWAVFELLDETIHPQVKKRFDVFNEILAEKNVSLYKISSSLPTYQERLFDMIYFLDWITYYRAIVWDKDPVEIDYIHLLKKRIS